MANCDYGLAGPPVKAGESVVTVALPAKGPLEFPIDSRGWPRADRPTDRAAGPRPGQIATIDHHLPSHDHIRDAGRRNRRILVGGAVDDRRGIEEWEIRIPAQRGDGPFYVSSRVRCSSRRAGSSVMRRSASINATAPSSRTYPAKHFTNKVPDVRGCPRPRSMKPSLAMIDSGLTMAARVCASGAAVDDDRAAFQRAPSRTTRG